MVAVKLHVVNMDLGTRTVGSTHGYDCVFPVIFEEAIWDAGDSNDEVEVVPSAHIPEAFCREDER